MNTTNIFKEHFLSLMVKGIRPIDDLDGAWSFKSIDSYGAMILNPNNIEIFEKFKNIEVFNDITIINGEEKDVLKLSSTLESSRMEFALICAYFVELGENNENRNLLETNPVGWTTKWETLLGNTVKNKTVYDVLSELLVLEHFIENNIKCTWRGPDASTKDFELEDSYVDVKSTTKRTDSKISISSQFQLLTDKPMYIYFCRLESMDLGESINKVAERLENLGYNMLKLETNLAEMGYPKYSKERNVGFDILERKIYEVDNEFPQITPKSFIDGRIPDNIISVSYTVDVSNISFKNW